MTTARLRLGAWMAAVVAAGLAGLVAPGQAGAAAPASATAIPLGAMPASPAAVAAMGPGVPAPGGGVSVARKPRLLYGRPVDRRPALVPVALADLPIRAAGRGTVTIAAARTVSPGRVAYRVRLRVTVRRGLRILRASGAGWRCAGRGRAAACALPSALRRGRTPQEVTVVLAGGARLRRGARTLTSRLTWRQREAAPIGRGGGPRLVRRGRTATTRVPVVGRLRARIELGGPRTVQVAAAGGTVLPLGGRLLGLEGQRADVRWVQRCVTRADARRLAACRKRVAPRARWQGARTALAETSTLAAAAVTPRLRDTQRFVFSLVARSGGARSVSTLAMTAVPAGVARLDPRLSKSRLRGRVVGLNQRGWTGARVGRAARIEIGNGRPRTVGAGTVRLALAGADRRRVRSVIWSVATDLKTPRLRRVGGSGPSLRLRVPASAAGRTWLVWATVGLRNGEWVQRIVLLRVRRPAGRAAAPPVRAAETPAEWICNLAKPGGLTFRIPGGWSVVASRKTAPDQQRCQDPNASITFDGTITGPAYQLAITGATITRAGLGFSRGTFTATAWKALGAVGATVPFTGSGLGAALSADGVWSAPAGSFTADVPLADRLPLPAGWSWNDPTFTFNGAGGFDVRQSATGPPEGGEALVGGQLGRTGTASLDVTATSLVLLKTATGDEAAISPAGKLSVSPSAITARAAGSVVEPGQIEVARNLGLRRLTATWTDAGISLSGDTAIQSGDTTVAATGTGTYRGPRDWTLNQKVAAEWKVVSGITIPSLSGAITRTGDDLSVSLTGPAKGWSPSDQIKVDKLTAEVTNRCPPDGADGCRTDTARLVMGVTGAIKIGGKPFETAANVDLKTLKFSLTAGISPDNWGPKELNLRKVTLNLTNTEGSGTCTKSSGHRAAAAGTRAPPGGSWGERARAAVDRRVEGRLAADQGLRLGVRAEGSVLGQTINVVGEVSATGYCLYGYPEGTLLPKEISATGKGRPSITNVALIYASFDADVTLQPTTPKGTPATVSVSKGELTLRADFTLPDDWTIAKKLPGKGEMSATLSKGDDGIGFKGVVSYKLSNPLYLVGNASKDNLALEAVALKIEAGGGVGFSITGEAKGAYSTVATRDAAKSRTPLKVALGFNFKDLGVTLTAGVDTAGGPVADAFGVEGLQIRTLQVAATLSADPSFGVTADITLPDRWTKDIRINPGTPINLTFNIAQASPCFKFGIGDEKAIYGTSSSATPALDIAGKGIVVADVASLYIAPTGCTVGDTELKAGFGLALKGRIGDYPVELAANVQLPTGKNFVGVPKGFRIEAKIRAKEFALGPVKLEQTSLDLLADSDKREFSLKIKGGLSFLDSRANVDLTVAANTSEILIKGSGAIDARVGGVGRVAGSALIDTKITRSGYKFKVERFNVAADVSFGVGFRVAGYNVTLASVRIRGNLDYDGAELRSFGGEFSFGVDLYVVDLGGGVRFAYRRPSCDQRSAYFVGAFGIASCIGRNGQLDANRRLPASIVVQVFGSIGNRLFGRSGFTIDIYRGSIAHRATGAEPLIAAAGAAA